MDAFWQLRTRVMGGDPGGGGGVLQKMRLAGSAFFIFGFPLEESVYVPAGRSSV
jgi:hypothetical protein